jgi:putative phage-type endonuclease
VKTLNLIQGSPEWHAHRATVWNASDAPAMMGCSPYVTREQLLQRLATGIECEVTPEQQRWFDDGHRSEALARPMVEQSILGEDLFPVTGVSVITVGGRHLSASFDGITLGEDTAFEHKRLNASIREAFERLQDGAVDADGLLPLVYRVQMQQQLMVSGAQRVLFLASEWDAAGELVDSRWCWYHGDQALGEQIVAGWEQFARDLAAWAPRQAQPVHTGRAPDALPALHIEVRGAVTASNLAEFKATALSAIRGVNRDLRTDQDFADADKAVKWCADVEARLKAAKEHALSQTASIDELFRALDDIGAEARAVRLDVEKLVKRRKDEVREHAVLAARRALDEHIAALNIELAPMRLQAAAADFAGAIKGLRSIASMQDALDNTLAAGRIAADAQARNIRQNLAAFKLAADGLEFLFSDLGQMVHKASDDFCAVIGARITKHRADEAAREAKRQADEAERIAAAAQSAREDEARRLRAEQDAAEREAAARAKDEQDREDARRRAEWLAAQQAAAPAPIGLAAVAPAGPAPAAAATQTETPTLKLGDINARLSPISLTAAGLAELGIQHSATDKAARLYRESDWPRICAALMQHLQRAAAGQMKAAA